MDRGQGRREGKMEGRTGGRKKRDGQEGRKDRRRTGTEGQVL